MITDSELNLDIPYEYAKDGTLVNAHNIVLSKDFTTIQNEPAIKEVSKLAYQEGATAVGHVVLNNRIIVFTNKNSIYTNSNDDIETFHKVNNTHWKWNGGIVFGTATRNVKNEIVVAISEHGNNDNTDYKVINIDRSINDALEEEAYKVNPNIPHFNIIDYYFVVGDKMHKGVYNFYIRYYLDEENTTAWFPIGPDILLYDENDSNERKNLVTHIISHQETPSGGGSDTGGGDSGGGGEIGGGGNLPDPEPMPDPFPPLTGKSGGASSGGASSNNNFNINYKLFDKYNEAGDDINLNIRVQLRSYNYAYSDKFLKFELAYINTFNSGTEARIVGNYSMSTDDVLVTNKGITISIEELTRPVFGLKGVNTLCAYNNRIYIGDYIETNKNRDCPKVNTKNIEVFMDSGYHNEFHGIGPGYYVYYNFYLHYVYPDGSFTDGIHIGKGFDGNNPNYSQADVDAANRGNSIELCVNNDGLGFFRTPRYYPTTRPNVCFSNIPTMPWAVGYFISYEELENAPIGVGVLVDINDSICDIFETSSPSSRSVFKFYYPEFNIVGGSINGNKLLLYEGNNVYKESIEKDAMYKLNPRDSQLVPGPSNEYKVLSSKVIAPNTSNNYGKEGYLQVTLGSKISPYSNTTMNTYMLVNSDYSNTYISKSKRLRSLGYIQYNQNGNYGFEDSIYNYHFYVCHSSVFGYAKRGIMISDTDDMPKNADDNSDFYKTKNDVNKRYIAGISYKAISKYPLDAKHIQFPSEVIVYNYESKQSIRGEGRDHDDGNGRGNGRGGYVRASDDNAPTTRSGGKYSGSHENNNSNQNAPSSNNTTEKSTTEKVIITNTQKLNKIIKPAYINDIYKLLPCFYDFYYRLNVNYDPTNKLNDINRFRKTIRRSDVIATESLNNGWLRFQPENYKIIAENKGKITNVVGAGHYLLVHTEHSLFNFDVNNVIQTNNKDVQLFTPDIFDVKYKELFTTSNGYGGLQDNVSWIFNEHGYIFYDRDANKIYRYDQNKVNDITHNIIKYISDKHYSVHIGNDKKNNRLLFRFVDGQSDKVISYYPGLNRWLSLHDYRIAYKSGNNNANPFINIKNDLYIIDMGLMGSNISRFYDKDIETPKYICDGVNDSTNGYIYNMEKYEGRTCSYLDVAFNYPTYDKIKVLDYITYILDKLPNTEGNILKIKLFSNCCYSDVIDINIPRRKVTEYKLPYYNFGKWHFNWFRNKIDKTHVDYVVDRETGKLNPNLNFIVKRGVDNALMTGNYIIIRFIFQNDDIEINIKDIQAYFKR